MAIEVKDLSSLKSMRKAGLVVAKTLKLIEQSAQIGMSTLELNEIAIENLAKHGAKILFPWLSRLSSCDLCFCK